MLVLSRKVGESIVINGDVRVTIVAARGNKVRLGIVAPEYVEVHREEIQAERDGNESGRVLCGS